MWQEAGVWCSRREGCGVTGGRGVAGERDVV